MKRIILLLGLLTSLLNWGCMKHDILKEDATGNFRESQFYSSGDFETQFELNITDTTILLVNRGNGIVECKPEFTIQLKEAYRAKIKEDWNGVYRLKVIRPTNPGNSLDFESTDLSAKFKVTSMPAVSCGVNLAFIVRLELVTPSTSIIARTENNYIMTTNP